ncbi:restriction endonuclease subunit S [Thermoproteota archaeon]
MGTTITKDYIHTEIGCIPKDWKVTTFNDLFTFLSTGSNSRSELTTEDGDVNYIHYGDIHKKWDLILDCDKAQIPFVSYEKIKNLPYVKNGDLIIADASEDYEGIGTSVEVKNVDDRKIVSGLHTLLLRGDKNQIVDGYKAYLTSIFSVKKALITIATGISVYGISKNALKDVKLPLPVELREQIAIVEILSNINSLINSLDQLIEKKKNIKKGLVQNIFTGKIRLENFYEEWVERNFSELCWFQEGPGLRNWQFRNEGIKVINVTNLENGLLNLENTDRHISLEEFHSMYRHFEIDKGDIVVASSGNSYGKVAIVRNEDLPLMMNTSVIRFKPLKGLVYEFLFQFLKSRKFKTQIDLLITGGAQPNFGPAHLKKIKILVPPSEKEQRAVGRLLSDMDSEIEVIEQKSEKYRQLKIGLIQQLLMGRTRLKWKS